MTTRYKGKYGKWPMTGFRSEIPGLDKHIATDPPLYKVEHIDGDETAVTYGRIYATGKQWVELFICTRQGAYITWNDGARQATQIPTADVISVRRVRATSNGWV